MTKPIINNIFPTPIYTTKMDRGFTKQELNFVKEQKNHCTNNQGTTKYIGSAYKSYGQPSFFGNLLSRGAPGYRGIKGLPVFGTPTFETRKRPDGSLEYFTEDEDFEETRDAVPFGIMGLISSIANKFKKPKDMSEFNQLSLTAPIDQKVYIPQGTDPSMIINDPFGQLLFADDQEDIETISI